MSRRSVSVVVLAGAALLLGSGLLSAFTGRAATPGPCATPQSGGTRELTVNVGGVTRPLLVHAPAAAAGRREALLVALPGEGGQAARMQSDTGLSALADRGGFVVAYLAPLHGRWAIQVTTARGRNDVAYVAEAISAAESLRCIARGSVALVGVSNGAGEAARAACALADRVSAAVLVAGAYRRLPACRPARPVSILEIHSTADRVAPYRRRGGVPAFLARWRRRDACRTPGTHVRLSKQLVRASWWCAGGARVAQLRFADLAHGWPQSATAIAWEFVRSAGGR